nr:uncharacterized protein LOC119179152 [Rhipicephalus microplus]
MKFPVVFVVAFGFICLTVTDADEETAQGPLKHKPCGIHEEFKECQSSSCGEWRCGEVRGALRPCTEDCRNDCFCSEEYNRHPNGTCVPQDHCPPSAVDQSEEPRGQSRRVARHDKLSSESFCSGETASTGFCRVHCYTE